MTVCNAGKPREKITCILATVIIFYIFQKLVYVWCVRGGMESHAPVEAKE